MIAQINMKNNQNKMRKVEFRLDEARMLNIGGGGLTSFCEQYSVNRKLMYHIKGKSYVKANTKSHKLVTKLINLGVGKYMNINKDDDV